MYHVSEPNPNHISCIISNTKPIIIVYLAPISFIIKPNTDWTAAENSPSNAISTDTLNILNPIT